MRSLLAGPRPKAATVTLHHCAVPFNIWQRL
jgi:hypothetical protein